MFFRRKTINAGRNEAREFPAIPDVSAIKGVFCHSNVIMNAS